MIHDATVEVTCDRKGCRGNMFVDLHAGSRNTYLADDSTIERELERNDWVMKDGKHFCCSDCANHKGKE